MTHKPEDHNNAGSALRKMYNSLCAMGTTISFFGGVPVQEWSEIVSPAEYERRSKGLCWWQKCEDEEK